jgi:hypothetical protein
LSVDFLELINPAFGSKIDFVIWIVTRWITRKSFLACCFQCANDQSALMDVYLTPSWSQI